jgi:hypothetical protein
VHHHPLEVVDARDLRRLWLRQHSGRADHEPCGDRIAALRVESPHVGVAVEARADDPGVEADPVAQAVLVDAVVGVGLELVAGRVHARPVGALLE